MTYDVEFGNKKPASPLTLTVSVVEGTKKIGGDATNAGLVVVTPDSNNPATIGSSKVTVTVVVTLNEPGSKEVYDAVKNKNITFDLKFAAA